jgi:FSR family fosmidomycin resistance protein-like MFS transporter
LILSLPAVVASLVEPVIGVLGDTPRRRLLILAGGTAFAGSLLLFAASPAVLVMLIASVIMYPASGAFVSLSQATLMDLEPERRERNMARWTAAGSLGVVGGSLVVAGCVVFHLGA